MHKYLFFFFSIFIINIYANDFRNINWNESSKTVKQKETLSQILFNDLEINQIITEMFKDILNPEDKMNILGYNTNLNNIKYYLQYTFINDSLKFISYRSEFKNITEAISEEEKINTELSMKYKELKKGLFCNDRKIINTEIKKINNKHIFQITFIQNNLDL